jgi:hypothetical protein
VHQEGSSLNHKKYGISQIQLVVFRQIHSYSLKYLQIKIQ